MVSPTPVIHPLKQRLQKHDPKFVQDSYAHRHALTPSIWFAQRYPDQAEKFGCPFLESVEEYDGLKFTKPLAMNNDFMAAILGGNNQLGHKVIYYTPELQFYFKDSDGIFKTTTEEKLKTLLSVLLVKCAEEMPATVDRFPLFVTFREDDQLKDITKKAKSILAAHPSFFAADSVNKRTDGPELPERSARIFAERVMLKDPALRITVDQTYQSFTEYCRENGLVLVDRRAFKRLMAEVVKEEFGIRLRHDIKVEDGKSKRGWSGVGIREIRPAKLGLN